MLLLCCPDALKAQKLGAPDKSHPPGWVNAEEDVIRFYAEFRRDSAMYLVEKYLARAKNTNNEIAKIKGLTLKGYILMKYGNFVESLKCFLAATEIAENPRLKKSIDGRSARYEGLAGIHLDWGNLLRNTEDFQQAKFHYFEAKKITDAENLTKLQALVNLGLGKLYIKLVQLDSALIFLKNAEYFSKQSGYLLYLGQIYKYRADIHWEKGYARQAKKYYFKTIQAAQNQKNRSALSLAFDGLAKVHAAEGQSDSCLYYAVLAKKELSSLQAQVSENWNISRANYNFYLAYELSRQPDSMLKYLRLTLIGQDSLNQIRVSRLAELQSLTFQEQLQLQQLEKEKIAIRNRIMSLSLFAGIGVLLLFVFFFYRNNLRNKVLHHTLESLEATQIQLIAQKERAEQSEKFKQRFLAHMSHEIRTPLHGIAGFTDLLLETSLSEKQRRWLSSIYHSTDRLDEVVNAVLELSKLEAGELKLRKIPFSPSKVASDVQDSLSLKAQNKGIDFLLDLHKDVPGALWGDPTRFYQILMNLTGNAVKFTEKGSVTMKIDCIESLERSPDDPNADRVILTMRIIDTGIGIPAEKITAVFDSFEQAGEDMVARYGGTGLGLTVTQELVELFGGDIHVESQLGVGTTFTVKIPFAVANKDDLQLENQDFSALYFAQDLNILLVDDNALNREIAYEAIIRHFENASITEAVNGKEALAKLALQDFDVVLMDMQMPEMSGTEAARRIRQLDNSLKCDLPIIALTASATPEEIEKALESGMNRHLGKPFKPHQLAKVMAETMGLEVDAELKKKGTDSNLTPQGTDLDLSFLRDFTDGDGARMQYFIQKFLHQYPLEIQKLEQALLAQDQQALYQNAHSFKPQLEFVGLKKSAAIAQQLEQTAQREASIPELSSLLTQLVESLKELPAADQW